MPSDWLIEILTAVLIDACIALVGLVLRVVNELFSIQRILFVLGGGFPGIYNILLTDRCWSANGNGVILSTAWRSYKVGISYRLINYYVSIFFL